MTGIPNISSSSQTRRGGKVEDAERITRSEDCRAFSWCPYAADNTAWWIVGTAVYQVGRNLLSKSKNEPASKPKVQTTLEPAESAAMIPEIKPCP